MRGAAVKKRKLPPVRQVRARKGNHAANPYAAEAKVLPRHEDREGWPFAARKADLTDEAQLGPPPPPLAPASPPSDEPVFMLPASDPLSGMIVRFWANANEQARPHEVAAARELAARMDAWRRRTVTNG